MSSPVEYFYNLSSGQVEEGRQSHGNDLMGPYPTREAAQNAFGNAKARNEEWEDEDEKWEDWGEGADAPRVV